MTKAEDERVYHRLVVTATDRSTDFWLVDDHWHPVQKATGILDTSVLAGRYFVEFGAASPVGLAYPVELACDLRLTQLELEVGPSCPRRPPELLNAQ
jgi:hypothetical protein